MPKPRGFYSNILFIFLTKMKPRGFHLVVKNHSEKKNWGFGTKPRFFFSAVSKYSHLLLRLSKFLSFGQFSGHFSTSGGSKKFSMGDMMMSKVFKMLPKMTAFQRTSNHDRTTDQSFFIDKSFNRPYAAAGFGPRFFIYRGCGL